jgi:DNA-binding NtrC family response regulator
VEAASGGIVCLEEIGNLSGDQQANLLAFLETKNLARPGGREPVQPDVQLLFTASQNLEEKVAGGKFRRDLYDRLQSSAVRLPRLRDHAQDIPALIWYFIQKFNAFYGRKIQRLAPEALLALQSAPWDGNVSELKTQVEAAVRNCAEQTLQVKDFANLSAPATELPRAAAGLDQPYREAKEKLLQEFHQAYLGHHLSQHNWNRSRTARAIGIMREQLNALVRRYKLARPKSNETGAAQ